MPEPSFDLRATIAHHPLPAVAIAFALGAGLALAERSRTIASMLVEQPPVTWTVNRRLR
jgi:hypothetical protein